MTPRAAAVLVRCRQPRVFDHLPALPQGPNTLIARRALHLPKDDHDHA
jgi:hypothetical protein